MSELIAEARVLVTPDTTKFRPLLIAQVNAAAKGVTVPVEVVPVGTTSTAAAVAAQRELAAASATTTTAALQQEAAVSAVSAAETRGATAA